MNMDGENHTVTADSGKAFDVKAIGGPDRHVRGAHDARGATPSTARITRTCTVFWSSNDRTRARARQRSRVAGSRAAGGDRARSGRRRGDPPAARAGLPAGGTGRHRPGQPVPHRGRRWPWWSRSPTAAGTRLAICRLPRGRPARSRPCCCTATSMSGAFGPIPSMYEPLWFTKKTVTAVAEAVATGRRCGRISVRNHGNPIRRTSDPNPLLVPPVAGRRPGRHLGGKPMNSMKKSLLLAAPALAIGLAALSHARRRLGRRRHVVPGQL